MNVPHSVLRQESGLELTHRHARRDPVVSAAQVSTNRSGSSVDKGYKGRGNNLWLRLLGVCLDFPRITQVFSG